MPVWFSSLMDQPLVYGLFHGIVSGNKSWYLRQELSRIHASSPLKVIDVGCGPGTNAHLFSDRTRFDYLGVDINPDYIRKASIKYGLDFQCVDITNAWKPHKQFDVVLINSVLHHLTDMQTSALLAASANCMTPAGRCLVMDMIYPKNASPFNAHRRMLIHLDRGEYCRTAEALESLLFEAFKLQHVQRFYLRPFFVPMWDMRLYVCNKK